MELNVLNQLIAQAQSIASLETPKKITWCGNCGNYGIQNALRRALVLEGYTRQNVLLCFDVGCNGNGSDKIELTTIHGLHGRVLPLAAGAALANHKIKVIASAGDGATFSEGVNHLVHAVRNDYPVLFLHHNNENYGLTTGQASALSRKGSKRTGAPKGVVIEPLNPLDFVLSLKPSFVARSFSGDVDHLTEMIRLGLQHKGFAFIDILQACPTYNRETPEEWYAARIKKVDTLESYDPTDLWQARKAVHETNEVVHTGLIFRDDSRINFLDADPVRKEKPLPLVAEVERVDISGLFETL